MSNKKKKLNNYASTPFTQVPDGLWLSPEFNSMTPHSRCLFMIMLAKWNPYTPEVPFVLTYDQIQDITKFNRNRVSKCIKELMLEGFIEIPVHGAYPHNVSTYQIKITVISKKYPRIRKTLPKYLEQFIKPDDA